MLLFASRGKRVNLERAIVKSGGKTAGGNERTIGMIEILTYNAGYCIMEAYSTILMRPASEKPRNSGCCDDPRYT
jgi:hypothetical protein